MGQWLQWGKNLGVGLGGLVLFLQGIEILRASYCLKNPLEFIMYFFSANILILIGSVGIIYPIVQIYILIKPWMSKRHDR